MQPTLYDQSRYQDTLAFNRPAPQSAAYFEHAFDGYELEGRIVYNIGHDKPWVLSIHGARADYTKSDPVTLALRDDGYSILSFNMSGHSDAGALKNTETSLSNNINEAEAFFQYLDTERPKIVIGYSLGGTPALKLLEKHSREIDRLVLFYPGIYTAAAYNLSYGEPFRNAVWEPFSYRNNDTIRLLSKFKGKVLLIVGEYDGLDPAAYGKPTGGSVGEVEIAGERRYSPIPKEVIDLVKAAVPDDQLDFITVSGCDHLVMKWMRENPSKAKKFTEQLGAFLHT